MKRDRQREAHKRRERAAAIAPAKVGRTSKNLQAGGRCPHCNAHLELRYPATRRDARRYEDARKAPDLLCENGHVWSVMPA